MVTVGPLYRVKRPECKGNQSSDEVRSEWSHTNIPRLHGMYKANFYVYLHLNPKPSKQGQETNAPAMYLECSNIDCPTALCGLLSPSFVQSLTISRLMTYIYIYIYVIPHR